MCVCVKCFCGIEPATLEGDACGLGSCRVDKVEFSESGVFRCFSARIVSPAVYMFVGMNMCVYVDMRVCVCVFVCVHVCILMYFAVSLPA